MLADRRRLAEDEPPPPEPSVLDTFGPAFEDAPVRGPRKVSPPAGMTPLADVVATHGDQFRFEPADPAAPLPDIAGTALIAVEAITRPEQAPTLAEQIVAFQVTDEETYTFATGTLVKAGTEGLKLLDEFFDADIARAYATHRGLTQKKAKYYGPLETAVNRLKAQAVAYAQEQERRREAEQRRRNDLAAAVRRQQEAEAERERVRLEAEAAAAVAQGDVHAAAALARQAQDVVDEVRFAPPPVAAPVASTVPTVKGVSVRAKWNYRITDKAAFIKAVAAGRIPLEAVGENTSYLKKRASADKTTLDWPGVEVYDEGLMAVRS